MFCPYCGKENPDTARFCGACGKGFASFSSNEQPDPCPIRRQTLSVKLPRGGSVAYYLFGILFILLGILPYILPREQGGDSAQVFLYASPEYCVTQAARLLNIFLSNSAPLFFFSSCTIAVYTGARLLTRASNTTASVVASIVTHGVSMVWACLAYTLVCNFPKTVLSHYTKNQDIINAGAEAVGQGEIYLQPFISNQILCSFLFLVLAIVCLCILKKRNVPAADDRCKIPAAGSILMILTLQPLMFISQYLTEMLIDQRFGAGYMVGISLAEIVYKVQMVSAVLVVIGLILVLPLILRKVKRWIVLVPGISMILLGGLAALALAQPMAREAGVIAEYFEYAKGSLMVKIVDTTILLIALLCWFDALARNRMPLWLQIAWPLMMVPIYGTVEILVVTMLDLGLFQMLGSVGIAVFTIVLSLVLPPRKQQTQKENQLLQI